MALSKEIRFCEIKEAVMLLPATGDLLKRSIEAVAALCEANEVHFRKDPGEASVITFAKPLRCL